MTPETRFSHLQLYLEQIWGRNTSVTTSWDHGKFNCEWIITSSLEFFGNPLKCNLSWLPCSLSSVLILLVWFHVLSMKTTLCRGSTFDTELFASSGVPDSELSDVRVEPWTCSVFNLFLHGSSVESCDLSCKHFFMSWTETALGPGNTNTTWSERRRRGTPSCKLCWGIKCVSNTCFYSGVIYKRLNLGSREQDVNCLTGEG